MKSISRFVLVLLVSLVIITSGFAIDIIKKKDGSIIKGTIVSETDKVVKIKSFGSTLEVPKSEIKEIVKGSKSPKEEFRERYKKIDRKDVFDLLDLADWCKENGMEKRARQLFRQVLKLESENEEAREALGFRKVNGKWLDPEQYKEHMRSQKASKESTLPGGGEAKGTTAVAPSAEGKEGAEQRAKAMRESFKATSKTLAEEMLDEIGLDEVVAAETDHYIMAGQLTQETIDQLIINAEVVYWDVGRRFNYKKETDLYKRRNKKHIILFFKNRSDFSDGFDFAVKKWAPGMAGSKSFAMSSGGFMAPSSYINLYKRLTDLPSKVTNDAAAMWITHHTRSARQEAKDNHRYLQWLSEGLGCWSAMLHTGKNVVWRTTRTTYDPQFEIAKKGGGDGLRLLAKEWAQGKMKSTYSRDLRTMMLQKLNRLNTVDLSLAFCLLDYSIRERQGELRKFFLGIREKPYLEAFQDAFGEALVPKFEETFKKWILANY